MEIAMPDEFKFQITEHFGELSESKSGWKMELNMVAWGNYSAKYDLRSWSPDHSKMGKGITLTRSELSALKKLLNEMNLD